MTPTQITLNQFQELANRTLPQIGMQHFFKVSTSDADSFDEFRQKIIDHARNVDLLHAGMGLASEVGEILDPIKAAMFYGKDLNAPDPKKKGQTGIENIKEEAGDALWYIAGPLCRALGITFEELAMGVISKLEKRYPDKYTDTAAVERADKQEEIFLAQVEFRPV